MASKQDPEVEEALQYAQDTGEVTRTIRVANTVNRRFVHDLIVKYIASITGAKVHDTAHHDLNLTTARGGRILIEVKVPALRRGKATIVNDGEPRHVTMVALVADPDSIVGPEILFLPAAMIRSGGWDTATGGWGMSLSRKKVADYRDRGHLLPFDEGMEKLVAITRD